MRTLVELEAMLASSSGFCGPVNTKFKGKSLNFEGAREKGKRKERERRKFLPPNRDHEQRKHTRRTLF